VTDAEKSPVTLMDVVELADRARLFIAHGFPHTPESIAAIRAVTELEILARRNLPVPNPRSLGWGLSHDPYCAAAFAHGQRSVERATPPSLPASQG
jgi:hypothetical protein